MGGEKGQETGAERGGMGCGGREEGEGGTREDDQRCCVWCSSRAGCKHTGAFELSYAFVAFRH
jgi:hypothetical protein